MKMKFEEWAINTIKELEKRSGHIRTGMTCTVEGLMEQRRTAKPNENGDIVIFYLKDERAGDPGHPDCKDNCVHLGVHRAVYNKNTDEVTV